MHEAIGLKHYIRQEAASVFGAMDDSFFCLHPALMAPKRKQTEPPPEITEPFLVKLRAYIEANKGNGVTEAGLATKAGLTNSTIRGWLSGKSKTPTLASARKVCAAMGTTLEAFLSDQQHEEGQRIVDLVLRLPAPQRQRLLDFGEGLLDGSRLALTEDPPKS